MGLNRKTKNMNVKKKTTKPVAPPFLLKHYLNLKLHKI